MPEPTIAERADAIVAGLDGFMRTCHRYRSPERVPASVADVREVAELVRDFARSVEERA